LCFLLKNFLVLLIFLITTVSPRNRKNYTLNKMMDTPSLGVCFVTLFMFLFHYVPCALGNQAFLSCDSVFECGNLTATFPFWGENRGEPCGHPLLKLSCDRVSNKTSINISNIFFNILHIDNTFKTIKLVRQDYSVSFCSTLSLKRYSYAEVKEITNLFAQEIGRGGYGIVYEGNLCEGLKVAVKVLKESKKNVEDFINEVASMSRTSYIHIVSLLGFCYEGSKRAIIYEFVENGSLDKFITSQPSLRIDLGKMYDIALGVARGLQYLHYACKTRIVHFDIKPQNILLGKDFCPKISDFGLARLCGSKESVLWMSETRGTIGYIAPEVFSRIYGRVSHKSDVYSYGMLVLEMMGARNRNTVSDSNSSSMYFPDWIYQGLEKGDCKRYLEDQITEDEDEEFARKMILVGLSCIQACPSDRPSMNRVVEMMEGSLSALEAPPKYLLHLSASPMPPSAPEDKNSISFEESA
ncbi:unnamed protein product, partial [Brassica rapa subsp. narinosa]